MTEAVPHTASAHALVGVVGLKKLTRWKELAADLAPSVTLAVEAGMVKGRRERHRASASEERCVANVVNDVGEG